jgi:hypothetical protein
MLVVVVMHLYEMYVCMRSLVRLFWHFHVLRSSRRIPAPLGGYYFQHRTKGPSMYITTLRLSKWDHWREDWVIMQIDAHNWLELSTTAPMGHRSDWENVLDLQRAYNPMLERI